MTIIATHSPVTSHAEVDLISIFRSLVRQKYLILTGGVLGMLVACVYVFSVSNEYRVSTVLSPAALNDFDAINRSGIYELSPRGALYRVADSLDSYDSRLGYFRSNKELQNAFMRDNRTLEQAFEDFNSKALKVIKSDAKGNGKASDYIGVDLHYSEGLDGKAVLNGLVKYAIASERRRLSSDLKVIVANRIKEVDAKLAAAKVDYQANKDSKIAKLLEGDAVRRAMLSDELRALRLQLRILRDNRIAELDEAISIARSLGIKNPSTPTSIGQGPTEFAGNIIRTEITNQRIPAYFLGFDALEAERQALLKRKTDDFADRRVAEIRKELAMLETNRKIQVLNSRENEELFLEGIELLRAERVRLASFNVDTENLLMVTIDRAPIDPLKPISPNKPMLLMLGAILGLAISVFVGIVRFLAIPSREFYDVDVEAIHQLTESPPLSRTISH